MRCFGCSATAAPSANLANQPAGEILLARLSSVVMGHVASATLLYGQSHHNGILSVALGPCQWLWGPGGGACLCCNSIHIGGVKTNTASGASAGEMTEDVGSGWIPLPRPFVS